MKRGAALDGLNLLTLVLESWPEADGGIGQHVEEVSVMLAAADDGGVVAGIAEVEVPRRQVQQPDEHGDEHGILVVGTRQLAVEQGAYLGGLLALSGQCHEEACGLCHEERGGYALAADVADGDGRW